MGETLENSREMNMNADELRRYQEMRREAQRKLAEEKRYYDEAQEAQKQQIQSSKQIQKVFHFDPNVVRGEEGKIDAAKEEMSRLAEEWREYQQLVKDNLELAIQIEKDKQKQQEELDREQKAAKEKIDKIPRGFRVMYNGMTNFGGGGSGTGKSGLAGAGGADDDPSKLPDYAKGLTTAFSRTLAAVSAVNFGLDAFAKVLQISNRIYRGQTEQQLAYMKNSPLEAQMAEIKMQRDVATSISSSIPLIGSSISKVIGASYDKQLAYLERRLSMENASREKLASLAFTNASNAVAYTEMQINQMFMRFREGQALSPVLKEYAQVQNELDKVRLEKSIKESINGMRENIKEMKEEVEFERQVEALMKQGYSEERARSGLKLAKNLDVNPSQITGVDKQSEFFDVAIQACKAFLDRDLGGSLDQLYEDLRQEVSDLNGNEVGYFPVTESGGPIFGRS